MEILKSKRMIIAIIISLFFGLFTGYLFFHDGGATGGKQTIMAQEEQTTIWTCSMHPQVRQEEPGRCPICAMELVPLNKLEAASDEQNPYAIQMSPAAVQLASIQTTPVRTGVPRKSLQLSGKVKTSENSLTELTARFSGRLENLRVNYAGQTVRKGEVLGTIYSPELIAAQEELLQALAYQKTNPSLYKVARNKLLLWDITEEQIRKIETTGQPLDYFPILAPVSGTVMERHVAAGDYVNTGMPLFTLSDLSRVWLILEAYESDIPWINLKDSVNFTVKALPGKNFTGRINYIDPFVDPDTRIIRARVEVDNRSGLLKPEMFATGTIDSETAEKGEVLLIPKSSVLWTGKRSLVYTRLPGQTAPTFHQREVELGPVASDYYVVKAGLKEGEEVVTHGAFKVDAAAQLSGLPSMMNTEGGQTGGHQHSMPMSELSELTSSDNLQTERFRVEGNCGMCKDRIEKAALSLQGVHRAEWGIESKQMTVTFNPETVDLMQIHKAIAAVGHNTDMVKAPDEVYQKLPECCLYRKGNEK